MRYNFSIRPLVGIHLSLVDRCSMGKAEFKNEFEAIISNLARPGNYIKNLGRKNEGLYRFLLNEWNGKYNTSPVSNIELVEAILYDVDIFCKYGSRKTFRWFGAKPTCARNCKCSVEARMQTNKDRYGAAYPLQSAAIMSQLEQTNLIRYGCKQALTSDVVRDKIKATNLEKYGAENVFGSEKIQNKIKDTLLMKYGVDHSSNIAGVQDRKRDTFIKLYGVDNPAKNELVVEKIKNTNLSRYGVEWTTLLEDVKEKIKHTNLVKYGGSPSALDKHVATQLSDADIVLPLYIEGGVDLVAKTFGVSRNTVYVYGKSAGIKFDKYVSSFEKSVLLFIKSVLPGDIDVICNDRKAIAPYELDIYVPGHNLAIECNGLFWHTEISGGKDKSYHSEKLKRCNEKGIRLINIFDYEWYSSQEKIKSLLKVSLGKGKTIYARECIVKPIDSLGANAFLDSYHRQGRCASSIRYGLYFEDELVQVMTIGKARFSKIYDYEMLRLCSKNDTIIIGGASKLLKNFMRDYTFSTLCSYADLSHNTGNIYDVLGFKFSHNSPPNYWYTKDYDAVIGRVSFQKHKLSKILDDYDETKTEWENMKRNGYDRVWDCGNAVWVLTNK